jgi:hypothetical protein
MTSSRWLLGLVAGGALAAGCTTPKIVTGITSRPGQMKFLYQQSHEQGLVQCKLTETGDISDCANKPIVFKEEE